jgi:hypothetical protein
MPFRFGPWEILLILPSFVVYFVPTIVAITKHDRNVIGIVLLNIFGGWTFVGWIIALVWSIIDQKQANHSNDNA